MAATALAYTTDGGSASPLFLDVWGMGNRGMFRTLRDLILRPGYLIRDYISGMQMAYFPPFKLLFLLTALSTAFLIVVREVGRGAEGIRVSYGLESEDGMAESV